MTRRLARIEILTLSLATLAAATAYGFGCFRPTGIALGGGAAVLDFLLIRKLATAALRRRAPVTRVVPLALAKSLVLLAVPALALLLPPAVVDGVSFAVGVSALPSAVVMDALLPMPFTTVGGEA